MKYFELNLVDDFRLNLKSVMKIEFNCCKSSITQTLGS